MKGMTREQRIQEIKYQYDAGVRLEADAAVKLQSKSATPTELAETVRVDMTRAGVWKAQAVKKAYVLGAEDRLAGRVGRVFDNDKLQATWLKGHMQQGIAMQKARAQEKTLAISR